MTRNDQVILIKLFYHHYCYYFCYVFFFSLPPIFILLATSISRFHTAAMIFSCFFVSSEIRLLCFYPLQLFLCYPRDVEKESALLFFFFSLKVRLAMRFSAKTNSRESSCIVVAFGCWLSYFRRVLALAKRAADHYSPFSQVHIYLVYTAPPSPPPKFCIIHCF